MPLSQEEADWAGLSAALAQEREAQIQAYSGLTGEGAARHERGDHLIGPRLGDCVRALADKLDGETIDSLVESSPREQLYAFHQALTHTALETMRRKNQDYASADNPFANFELCSVVGLCSTREGILVRLMDKLRRLCTYEKAGEFAVEDEGPLDTVEDAINYLILYGYLLKQGR